MSFNRHRNGKSNFKYIDYDSRWHQYFWIYQGECYTFIYVKISLHKAPHNSNNYRRLVHDLPVSIIPVREWDEYQQPKIKEYNVRKSNTSKNFFFWMSYSKQISIQMPSIKSLRVLCDKMKNLSPTITICCLSSGDLSFIVETDSAIVVSRYFNLILDHCAGRNEDKSQPLEICCRVDTKQLSMCFGSIQVNWEFYISIVIFQSKLFIFTAPERCDGWQYVTRWTVKHKNKSSW